MGRYGRGGDNVPHLAPAALVVPVIHVEGLQKLPQLFDAEAGIDKTPVLRRGVDILKNFAELFFFPFDHNADQYSKKRQDGEQTQITR